MHDIRTIRNDPEAFAAALASRGHAVSVADIVRLDEARMESHRASQAYTTHVAGFGKTLGQAKALGDGARVVALMDELVAAREASRQAMREAADRDKDLHAVLSGIPCAPVPTNGPGESGWSRPEGNPGRPDAFEVAEILGMYAFTGISNGAWWKQVLLTGRLAAMQRAIAQAAATAYETAGWLETAPPEVVEGKSAFGDASDARPVTDGVEPMLALLRDDGALELAASGLFGLVGERRTLRGSGRDGGGSFFPDGPSVEVLRSHGGEPGVLDEAFAPARSLLDALGVAHRTREVNATQLGFHEARALVLEARREAGNHPIEVGRIADASDFLSRRMGTRLGSRRDGAFPRLLLGTALSTGAATQAAIEANFIEGKVVVPDVLARFLGGASIARAG